MPIWRGRDTLFWPAMGYNLIYCESPILDHYIWDSDVWKRIFMQVFFYGISTNQSTLCFRPYTCNNSYLSYNMVTCVARVTEDWLTAAPAHQLTKPWSLTHDVHVGSRCTLTKTQSHQWMATSEDNEDRRPVSLHLVEFIGTCDMPIKTSLLVRVSLGMSGSSLSLSWPIHGKHLGSISNSTHVCPALNFAHGQNLNHPLIQPRKCIMWPVDFGMATHWLHMALTQLTGG